MSWFRQAARSVTTLGTQTHWLIAAPPNLDKEVRRIVSEETEGSGVKVDISTRNTPNVAKVRNDLARRTDANYVMHFDADDLLSAIGIDTLVTRISESSMVWGAAPVMDFNEKTSPTFPAPDNLIFEDGVIPRGFVSFSRRDTTKVLPVGIPSIVGAASICRRDVFLSLGGHDEFLGNRWEDYIFLAYLSEREEGVWSPMPGYIYRKSPNSSTSGELTDAYMEQQDRYLRAMEDGFHDVRDASPPLPSIKAVRSRVGMDRVL